jgi:hypothetical protein
MYLNNYKLQRIYPPYNHPMDQTRKSPNLSFALSLCATTMRAAHGGR